jgi:F0F1-type ATP synthase membrane subunit b/b'
MSDAAPVFIQYGALGAIALLALYAVVKLFARVTSAADAAVAAERARADRHEEELRRLNTTVQEKLLPILVQATQVLGDVLVELREERRGRP